MGHIVSSVAEADRRLPAKKITSYACCEFSKTAKCFS